LTQPAGTRRADARRGAARSATTVNVGLAWLEVGKTQSPCNWEILHAVHSTLGVDDAGTRSVPIRAVPSDWVQPIGHGRHSRTRTLGRIRAKGSIPLRGLSRRGGARARLTVANVKLGYSASRRTAVGMRAHPGSELKVTRLSGFGFCSAYEKSRLNQIRLGLDDDRRKLNARRVCGHSACARRSRRHRRGPTTILRMMLEPRSRTLDRPSP